MAERLFALLLRLFPPSFRTAYGDTLLETLSQRASDARASGRAPALAFLLREAAGLVRNAAVERSAERRRRRGSGGALTAAAWRSPLRQVRRHPLYALACAGTLALGVAAAATSVAVLRTAFLEPLPYEDDRELVSLFTRTETWPDAPVSAHVVEDLRAADAPFAAYASMDPMGVAFSDGESTQSLGALAVTPEYFATLGVRPALGRVWTEGESDAAVVSWGFWQTSLAGAADVAGRRILVDGVSRTVVGVMGREFVPPFWPDMALFLPLDVPDLLATTQRSSLPLSVIVRRADGVSTERVNTYLAAFSERLRTEHGATHAGEAWHVVPLRTFLVGEASSALLGSAAAAALLLLIVCANVAGLSAARAIGEGHQTAVQLALGATRSRLLRERVLDGLALSAIGCTVGLWLAYLLVRSLAASQAQFLGRLPAISLDAGAAFVAALLGLGAGVLATVLPWGASYAGRPASLTGTRGAVGNTHVTTLRSGLVVLQVAMALVLLVGAGLLVRTLQHLARTSLGFEPAGLVTMSVSMPRERYPELDAQVGFERDVVERLERIGGVTAATASVGVPVIGGGRADVRVFGRTDDAARGEVAYLLLAPDFIAESGMRVLEGRGIEETDRSGGPPVAVLNETAVRRFFPDGEAIGQRIRMGPDTEDNEWITVVGIVADIRQHGPTEAVLPTAFASTWQFSGPQRWFTVRAPTPPADLREQMRAAVNAIDGGAAIARLAAIDELVSDRTARQRLVLLAIGFYGLVATVLCAFGVYAVVSLTSRLRRREYAIRMAIGAQGRAVRWLVLRQALLLGVLGTAAGLALSAGGTRVLRGLLHGVAPLDPSTFAIATGGVLALAMMSAWWPARRAGRVDPAETLKE